jgi:hypothetical protein
MQKLMERKTNKAIKKITAPYNVDFIVQWLKTTNYQIWLQLHDKNICFRSQFVREASNIHITYENGDIYSGNLTRGMKHGFGIFNDIEKGLIYNGSWENDQVYIALI